MIVYRIVGDTCQDDIRTIRAVKIDRDERRRRTDIVLQTVSFEVTADCSPEELVQLARRLLNG